MVSRLAERVLLIGWDAADWQVIGPLLQAGQMPALQQLLGRGVHGNLKTLMPILSPLLWTSIATGKRADKHGILGFVEPDSVVGKLRPVSSTSRQGKAVWNILSQQGLRTHVIGWLASHPAEPINGIAISNLYALPTGPRGQPWPVQPGTIHPQRLEDSLAGLRVHPEDLRVKDLLPFVPEQALAGEVRDGRLAELAVAVAECNSIDQATSWILENEPWDFLAVYYNAIDHLGHHFMPFYPPRREGIAEEEFARYQHVIAGIYRRQDRLLGAMLERAGPETTVLLLSDHGFYSDERRPPAASHSRLKNARLWHRPVGVLCLAGPPIKQREVLHGASILDITPTVLTLFGLPVGEDMDGRPLADAFTTTGAPEWIPSWELVPGVDWMHPPGQQEDPWEAQQVLRQLAALGYLEDIGDNQQLAIERVRTERVFHLAVHYLETGRPGQAVPHFEELLRAEPANLDFLLYLARCHFDLGQKEACRDLLEHIMQRQADSAHAELLWGRLCLAEEEDEAALAHLLRAESLAPRLPTLQATIGQVYLRRHQWEEAEQAFRRAVELDRDSVYGYLGLAHVALVQRRFADAVAAAHRAVTLNYHLAEPHYVLGIALARLNQAQPALHAFETCLQMDPQSAEAHKWMAALHEQATGDRIKAAEHRRRAEELARSCKTRGTRAESQSSPNRTTG